MTAPNPAANSRAQAPISVIVPSYNGGRYIAEALDSIFAQSLQPEQIVVVDDGSSDNTAEVVGRYTDARLQLIRKPHGGAASARNAGLDAARGEYIAFLDADDRWGPMFIERTHGYLDADPTMICVFGNFAYFLHETGELLRDQFHLYPEIKRPVMLKDEPNAHGRIPREKAFSALVACSEIPAYTQVMMFRRAMIEKLRFDTALASAADIHFVLQTFLLGGVIFTDEVLALVRRHDRDASRERERLTLSTLTGLKAIAPQVTRDVDLRAYRDRLIKAHVDAAVYQAKTGRVRDGLRTYGETFGVPGSSLRKLKGSLRMAATLPRGLTK
jgi:glycosyltransferase involved in cell wall biosynthesis